MNVHASQFNQAGLEALARGDSPGAIEAFTKAVGVDPFHATAWINLGQEYKRLQSWADARDAYLKALDCSEPGKQRVATAWNLGIAATAVADWSTAFLAWARLNLPVTRWPDGSPALAGGTMPVRIVGAHGHLEVVWCQQVDPARARLSSIPTPESGHRHGDLVLHDWEPQGKRLLAGKVAPVFNSLARLQVSTAGAWAVDIEAPAPADADELIEAVRALPGYAVEDWTVTRTMICKPCALCEEHEPHEERDRIEGWMSSRKISFAGQDVERLRALLEKWSQDSEYRTWSEPVSLL